MDVVGGHLVHEREMRHDDVHDLDRDVHARRARIRLDAASAGSGNGSKLSQYGMVRKVGAGAEQVVQMRGAGAGQARDDHGRQQFDVVDLGVPRQQVGEQQPVLEPLQQLPKKLTMPGACMPSISCSAAR